VKVESVARVVFSSPTGRHVVSATAAADLTQIYGRDVEEVRPVPHYRIASQKSLPKPTIYR